MSVKLALNFEANAISSTPISLPFEFTEKASVPEGKNPGDAIVIRPATVGTWFKLKPLLAQIEQKDIDLLIAKEDKIFDAEISDMISKYDSLLFEIACIGIHNKKGDMPEWFRNTLKDNCSFNDLYIILNAIIYRLGGGSFTNSITALKAVSPLSEAEIIALQDNKESWNRKAASCSS